MKTVKIFCIDTDFDSDFKGCVTVSGFPDFDENGVDTTTDPAGCTTIINPHELVTKLEQLEILFDYPITNPVKITAKQKCGFTRLELYKAIHVGYKFIYDTEKRQAGDPGDAPGMANRMRSDGSFGIWGHSMTDLVIEAVHISDDGSVNLGIGS